MQSHQGSLVFLNNSRETFTPTASGAIATWIYEVCREAARDGVEPIVMTRRAAEPEFAWPRLHHVTTAPPLPPALEKAERAGRRVTGWSSVGQAVYARQARRALSRIHPATVICHNDPQVALYLARRLTGTRVLHWFHNLEVPSDRWRRRFFEMSSQVTPVAVSRYLARAVEHAFNLDPGSVPVIYNGVDLQVFVPRADATRRVPVVGYLGRMGQEKGADVLLDACLRLAGRLPFAVQLVGASHWGRDERVPFTNVLDDRCRRLAAQGVEVTRTGHLGREDIPSAIAATDIHVVPSRWDEPFGLTVLEGLATGLPVVATAVGGIPEILGPVGLLVPRDDDEGIARALEGLLRDPVQRRQHGAASRCRAAEFSWERTWRALAALLADLP